jgi:FkbM family methyltransferase
VSHRVVGAASSVVNRVAGLFGLEVRRRRPPAPRKPPDPHATLGRHVAALLERLEVDCVIDVGAHEGGFGRLIRDNGWAGRLVSFEPVRSSFERLQAAAAPDASWTPHRLALGREAGRAAMHVTEGTVFSSFHERSETGAELWPAWTRTVRDEQVDVTRLDVVLDTLGIEPAPQRMFLKMDTQGHDLEVFAGATGVLDRVVGLQSEVSLRPIYQGIPSFRDALATFEDAGFAITGLYPVTRDPDWRVVEYDCVMIRAAVAEP